MKFQISYWYCVDLRSRREQEDDRWCGKVPVSALPHRREDLLRWRRLEYDFSCLLAFVPCFLLFVFLFFLFFPCIPVCSSSSCLFVCAAAICYSQQVRILKYVFFLLVSFVPYPISEIFCFYSFSLQQSWLLFLGWRFFFCCALVPGTLALDLPTLIL